MNSTPLPEEWEPLLKEIELVWISDLGDSFMGKLGVSKNYKEVDRLIRSLLLQSYEQGKRDVLKEKINVIDLLMLGIMDLPIEQRIREKIARIADKLVGKDREKMYKQDSLTNERKEKE